MGRARALVGFAAFGLFWGAWGGALPAVRAHAGVDDGQLGLALLCVGAGALASMRPAGAVVDRFGARVLPLALAAFAACAVLPALATSAPGLGGALLALGAVSGALDVAINAEGVRAEASAGRPLMNLAHAAFSASVVIASLLAGAGAGVVAIFAGVGAGLLAAALVLGRLPAAPAAPPPAAAGLRAAARPAAARPHRRAHRPGLLHRERVAELERRDLELDLHAAPSVAALGPALFAAAAVLGRLTGQALAARVGGATLVAGGALLAAAGTLGATIAPTPAPALTGIAAAGLGTSVCPPTLISLAGRSAGAGAPPRCRS